MKLKLDGLCFDVSGLSTLLLTDRPLLQLRPLDRFLLFEPFTLNLIFKSNTYFYSIGSIPMVLSKLYSSPVKAKSSVI